MPIDVDGDYSLYYVETEGAIDLEELKTTAVGDHPADNDSCAEDVKPALFC